MRETQKTRVQSLGQEDPLEEGMATHSSILASEIPWTGEPGGLWSWVTKSWTPVSDQAHPHLSRCYLSSVYIFFFMNSLILRTPVLTAMRFSDCPVFLFRVFPVQWRVFCWSYPRSKSFGSIHFFGYFYDEQAIPKTLVFSQRSQEPTSFNMSIPSSEIFILNYFFHLWMLFFFFLKASSEK